VIMPVMSSRLRAIAQDGAYRTDQR
jgi:hypothetical protein